MTRLKTITKHFSRPRQMLFGAKISASGLRDNCKRTEMLWFSTASSLPLPSKWTWHARTSSLAAILSFVTPTTSALAPRVATKSRKAAATNRNSSLRDTLMFKLPPNWVPMATSFTRLEGTFPYPTTSIQSSLLPLSHRMMLLFRSMESRLLLQWNTSIQPRLNSRVMILAVL